VCESTLLAEDLFKNRCSGTAWEVAFTRSWRYAGVALGGDLSTLLKEVPADERDARENADSHGQGMLILVKPTAALIEDDAAQALQYLESERATLPAGFTSVHMWALDRTIDALLYAGRAEEAWRHVHAVWADFKQSPLPRARVFKLNALFMRGRAALAAARQLGGSQYVDDARDCAASLRAFSRPDAQVYGALLEAALAFQEKEIAPAQALLESAVQVSRAAAMHNFTHYANHQLGVVLGTGGKPLMDEAERALRKMSVRNPARWIATYAPGFE
jgi:hypothetical protein